AGLLFLLTDAATSIVGGQGSLSVTVGGAEAASGDLVLEDLLGGATDVSDPDTPGPAPTPGSVPVLGSGPRPSIDGPTQVATGPLADRCESVHEQRPRQCRGGALLP